MCMCWTAAAALYCNSAQTALRWPAPCEPPYECTWATVNHNLACPPFLRAMQAAGRAPAAAAVAGRGRGRAGYNPLAAAAGTSVATPPQPAGAWSTPGASAAAVAGPYGTPPPLGGPPGMRPAAAGRGAGRGGAYRPVGLQAGAGPPGYAPLGTPVPGYAAPRAPAPAGVWAATASLRQPAYQPVYPSQQPPAAPVSTLHVCALRCAVLHVALACTPAAASAPVMRSQAWLAVCGSLCSWDGFFS